MFHLLLHSNANRFLFFINFLLKSGFFSKWFFSIICRVSSKNYSFPIEGIAFCQQYSKICPRSRRSSIGWFGLLSDLEDLQIYNWLFITKFWGVGYLDPIGKRFLVTLSVFFENTCEWKVCENICNVV